MARLTEYKGKALLREFDISTPRGALAETPEAVQHITADLNSSVVLKAQAFVTGRLSKGLVHFAASPEEAFQKSLLLFDMEIEGYRVEQVLVEERIDIAAEYFISIFINDEKSVPVIMFSASGALALKTLQKKALRPFSPLKLISSKASAGKLVSHCWRKQGSAIVTGISCWRYCLTSGMPPVDLKRAP